MSADSSQEELSYVAVLHRVSSIVSSNLSVDEMLGEVIGLAVQATACDACLVYLIEPSTRQFVLRGSQVPHAADLGRLRLRAGEGVTGWVAEHNSAVALSEHASSDERFKHFHQLVEDTYEALLSVPLVSAGTVIGIVNVHHRQTHRHTAAEIALVSFIGEQMGNALTKSMLADENEILQEEARAMRRELESRKLIERAKGILQHRDRITEEQAYLRLRNQSRRLQKPMRELAEAIIMADEIGRSPAGE